MTWRIPNMVPEITDADRAAVQATLLDGYACGGPVVQQLEERFADMVGAQYAVALSSGSAALLLAYKAMLGADHGEPVVTGDMTFIATATQALHVGADMMLVDCYKDTWQMNVGALGQLLHDHPDIAVVALPHLWGGCVDEQKVAQLCRKAGVDLIADCCQALGATVHHQQPGSWSDAACWSFNGNKIITGGGGGMLTTNRGMLAATVRYLADQGKDDGARWMHHCPGYNFRISAMQAALALNQLDRWGDHVARKWEIHQRYLDAFHSTVLQPRTIPHNVSPSMWGSTWDFPEGSEGLIYGLRAQGIEARRPFAPLSWQRPFIGAHLERTRLSPLDTNVNRVIWGPSRAEHIHTHGVLLPCSVGLTKDDQNVVIKAVKEALK